MNMKALIREQLLVAFPVNQAEVLADVVVEAHDALATKSDIHEIRDILREVAEIHRDTDRKMAGLAESQRDTDRKMGEMVEAQRETDRKLAHMLEAQEETGRRMSVTDQRFAELAEAVRESFRRHDRADGWTYELLLAKRLPSYVGRHFKRCRVVEVQDVIESLEPLVASGVLTDAEIEDLRLADLIATARIDGEQGYLVGEVSCTGDSEDIVRAARRAAVATKAGHRAVPFVACYDISEAGAEAAARAGVLVVRRGTLLSVAS